MFEKKYTHISDPYKKSTNNTEPVRNIYFGEVIDINDPISGGRLKVRIADLDSKTANEDLPFANPLLPKFLWVYPKVGEIVRVFIDDARFPQANRVWLGSVISQPQKFEYDSYYNALSTTNLGTTKPLPSIDTYPEAKGVFPKINDIAIIGRDNTDIVLKEKEIELRVGKHKVDDILYLNRKNPASFKMRIEEDGNRSSNIMIADKIAILSHDGIPKFSSFNINKEERDKIFETGHPMTRGDVLLQALEIIRKVIVNHSHPYDRLSPDKDNLINELEKLDFTKILQKNIVIN